MNGHRARLIRRFADVAASVTPGLSAKTFARRVRRVVTRGGHGTPDDSMRHLR